MRRPSVWDAVTRSSTSTSCACRPTSSGTSDVCGARTASRCSTRHARVSCATNSSTASETTSGRPTSIAPALSFAPRLEPIFSTNHSNHRLFSFLRTDSTVIGPILWGHSGPLCHALSLLSSSSSLLLWIIDEQAACVRQ